MVSSRCSRSGCGGCKNQTHGYPKTEAALKDGCKLYFTNCENSTPNSTTKFSKCTKCFIHQQIQFNIHGDAPFEWNTQRFYLMNNLFDLFILTWFGLWEPIYMKAPLSSLGQWEVATLLKEGVNSWLIWLIITAVIQVILEWNMHGIHNTHPPQSSSFLSSKYVPPICAMAIFIVNITKGM